MYSKATAFVLALIIKIIIAKTITSFLKSFFIVLNKLLYSNLFGYSCNS